MKLKLISIAVDGTETVIKELSTRRKIFDRSVIDAFLLSDLQKSVGGYVEIASVKSDIIVLANEEGMLTGMNYNKIGSSVAGFHLVGPIGTITYSK